MQENESRRGIPQRNSETTVLTKQDFVIAMFANNMAALNKDQRFAGHTSEELQKVAFCRGVYAFDKQENGQEFNFEVFDRKLSNREIVEKLPELPSDAVKIIEQNRENKNNKEINDGDYSL